LTWWATFFVWYTRHNLIEDYKKSLDESVFTCVELSKQSWQEVMSMPVLKLNNYLKWKDDLEEEKKRKIDEIKEKNATGG